MNKNQKYAEAARATLTDEEIRRAGENFAYGAKRFPAEHAEAVALITAKGLAGHREVASYYASHKMPISARELSVIELYKDTSYAGAFGQGVAHEAPSTSGGTAADSIFRPTMKPDGA
ncbi:hypothetical protein ASC97_12490 [Rhizobium sp. Root1203]|uniref:hypothetical protein n=1 Tax=Rhizobium sp. Root1203 TaxID=1736427 RepID=UPI00070AC0A5|nr:hypothetical protein [Rhizobium sp. Root1203]KQV14019.1 hypothetical protein ASC97_12490 [Rhizobium sp. Root1203]